MSQITDICKILSVEARVKILQLLKERSLCVNAITQRLNISQSAISQHLRILKSAGFVKAEKRGYWIHYHLNTKKIKSCKDAIDRILTIKKLK